MTCSPVNRWYSLKKGQIKGQIKTKTKKTCYTLQHVRTNSQCMFIKSVLNLSWRRPLLYRNQSIDLQSRSINWFLNDKNLRHERFNALLLACIHGDQGEMSLPNSCWHLFLDHDKIIGIYASKYQRRMFLINSLGKN